MSSANKHFNLKLQSDAYQVRCCGEEVAFECDHLQNNPEHVHIRMTAMLQQELRVFSLSKDDFLCVSVTV